MSADLVSTSTSLRKRQPPTCKKVYNRQMETKSCSKCKLDLPVAEFYPHRRMKRGYQSHCRTCTRAWHKARPEYVKEKNRLFYEQNPTYRRDYRLKTKYGIEFSAVLAFLAKQKNRCAGCGREFGELKMCVDHCHSTGKVRGLLCDCCNRALGMMREDPKAIRKLASYIVREGI
jgi:hypothetical protein